MTYNHDSRDSRAARPGDAVCSVFVGEEISLEKLQQAAPEGQENPKSELLSRQCVSPVHKVDKGKAPVLASVPVVSDVDPRDGAKWTEKILQHGNSRWAH